MTKKNKRSYKNVLKQLIRLCKKLFDGEFSPTNWMVDFEIRYVTAQTKKIYLILKSILQAIIRLSFSVFGKQLKKSSIKTALLSIFGDAFFISVP